MSSSFWSKVPQGPPDAVFGVAEAYKLDSNPNKVNLSVGAYRTDNGKPWVLDSVLQAEKMLLDEKLDKEYAPIGGLQEFSVAASKLAFGQDSTILKNKQNVTVQTLSGTGALKVGASFIKQYLEKSQDVYLPKPTWPNHPNVFSTTGLNVKSYTYFNPETKGIDETQLLQDIKNMPENAVILLHACAHNPTGVDPTKQQWKRISDVIKARKLLPFFDMAYQGFASGSLDNDAYAVRLFANEGHQVILAQSFAKNMGLYGERVGALTIVCEDQDEVKRVMSQVKRVIRPMYSNPPLHGARLALKIMKTPALEQQWFDELKVMSGRILQMRQLLVSHLEKLGSTIKWNHVTDQIGMFCYTGLNPEQVDVLTKKHSIYLTKDGRISIPGLTTKNVEYVAKAIHEVTSK
ncbi:hypothetical protein GJ496_007010 [Pomphorhynchus laevis]|nr:hypothetical protein GJ496_007010 [Pomphorhynchus laevis]